MYGGSSSNFTIHLKIMVITDSLASLIRSLSKSFRQLCLDFTFRGVSKRGIDLHLGSLYVILFQSMKFEDKDLN